MLRILHTPGDLLLSGATWHHCVMLVRHICRSSETSSLQITTYTEVVQVVLDDRENRKFMAALSGSGRWAFQMGRDLTIPS